MKQNLGKILAIIGGIAIILFILFYKPYKIKDIEYEKNNYVIDRTGNEYFIDVLHVGLNELDIKEVAIVVRPMIGTSDLGSDVHIKAYILGTADQFSIYSNIGTSKIEAIEILSHELIHLKQHYDERLVYVNNIIKFEDSIYFTGMLPTYFERPWEVEAFEQGEELAVHIRDKLLTK